MNWEQMCGQGADPYPSANGMWSPFSSPPPAENKADSSSSEILEDPFLDPFDEEEQGGSFGSSLPPPPRDIISERDEDDAPPRRPPSIDMRTLTGVNPALIGAVAGLGPRKQSAKEASYLKFSRRSLYERTMYNAGCAYLGGE